MGSFCRIQRAAHAGLGIWRRLAMLSAIAAFVAASHPALAQERPNVLWITSEDNGPHLGCYGDSYSVTPHLDQLAARGMRYTNAWSTAPVCAPARTVILTGMWAPSLGAHHMRSLVRMPNDFQPYPWHLRQAGYYCTNNSKTDYNVAVNMRQAWNESSNRAHWRNRRAGQPFFAVFNFTISHESQIRNNIQEANRIHDPAKVRLPAYHPDTPEVRKDWAQYYDRLTMMDAQCGAVLDELREDGLDDDTIVFYYGDHGSGMPRNKRCPYNSGLNVPLIVYVPPKWQHLAPPDYEPGGQSDRLVSFYDLAPTLLNICGIQPPANMHGQPFMGDRQRVAPEPEYAFAFRDRMDARYDMMRSVRDKRYVYVRHFMPHKPHGQYLDYMFQTPTTRVWKALFDAGKLTPEQAQFWVPKPVEELFDLENDKDEVRNLAGSPEHAEVLRRMRGVLRDRLLKWRDLGFLPEGEIHSRAGDEAPWTMAQSDTRYPVERIIDAAYLASDVRQEARGELIERLEDPDSAVRYWAALGLQMRGSDAVEAAAEPLRKVLADPAPAVRVTAAEALGRYGSQGDVSKALELLVDHANLQSHDTFTAMLALNALVHVEGEKLQAVGPAIASLPAQVDPMPRRAEGYVGRLLEELRAELARVSPDGSSNSPTAR